MQYSSKFINLLFLVCGVLIGSWFSHTEVDVETPTDIIKTVAHVPINNPNFINIYSDADNDIAYYMYVGDRGLVHNGDTVYLYDGTACTVMSSDVYGFSMRGGVFYTGLSGTVVTNSSGNPIGYVSRLLDSDTCYCIWC